MNKSLISLNQILRDKWLFFTLGLIFAVTSSVHATVLFSDNFDSYANGTADAGYKSNYAGASGSPTFVITNSGLSSSKSFQATGDGTLIRTNVPINLAAGPATIDIFFQRGTAGQAASPQVGLMTNSTGALNTSESVGGRFNNLEALDVRSTVGGAQSSVGTAPGATLTTGNWYFLRSIITSNAAANSLTVVLQLFNSSSAGVVGTGIVTNTQTFNNASVYAAAAKLYAAVRLSGNTGVTNMDNFSVSQPDPAAPTITLTGTLGALSTVVGTASSSNIFIISAVNLTGAPGNLTVTPPAGFEVSSTNNSGYSTNNLSVPYSSGTLASTNVYVRLAATTAVGTYSGNITVAGGGTTNTIAQASSTVNGGSPAITLTGTLGALSTTYGTVSSSNIFAISGVNFTGAPGNLTVTPPSGFEVSLSSGSGYTTNLSVPYSSSTLASTNVYVRLTATATVPGSPYSGNITVVGGGTSNSIATASSTVSKVTPTVTVTVGSYAVSGSPQGPNTITTFPSGDTGTATWSYVGVSGTTYGPSATRPTTVGNYTAQVTALTADANFNSSSSSATAFSIDNVNVLFADDYTVSAGSQNVNFENTLGRETGALSPLTYLTNKTGANGFQQQVGNTSDNFPIFANALFFRNDGGVRVDKDFSTNTAPLEIKWSVVFNWFGLPNTNSLIVGNRTDGYDPTNAVFAFQLRKDGTTSIYTNGVATAGASANSLAENVFVNYKVILSDTAGTGSAFGSGGSKAAYYTNGVLLGTATLSQLTAGQGYIGFIGGQGNVGIDNLRISTVNPASISLAGTLGAVDTIFGTASPTPTSFQISGISLTNPPGNLTVTPPAGYEVSLSSGSGYSTSLLVPYSFGNLSSTNVYVRLAATTAVGTYFGNITVVGGGASNSIATASSTVSPASAITTTTTVATSGSPSTYGQSVTFTATIAPASGAVVPTGTVQFRTNGVPLGSPVTVTTGASPNGTASISTANLPVTGSPHMVTADYTTDTNSFASSTGTLSGGQAVNKATATVTVTPYAVTYDGSSHTATAGTVTGVNGETGATVGTFTLSGTTHTAAGSYPSDSWTLTGGANYNNIGSTTISNNINKATPTVTVTGGSYTYNGSPQGPNTFTTIPSGDTGTATWEYVGVSGTAYGPSATRPTAAGYYTAQVTALTADANFNSSSSSATAFTIVNTTALFADDYTVSVGSVNINFENTLGRETGSLFPLTYLTRYTGGSAFLQQVGNTTGFTTTTNVLFLRGDAGVRVDYDFSTVGAPIEIKFSTIMNWFGLPNTNSLIVGNRSDGYDPTNAAFAFQLRKDGTTSIYTNGVATVGTSGTNFGENVLVDYKVVLTDTAGTGSPFGSGGSKAAYYQGGTLLGTATLTQLTAGQGYIGFIGGQGNVGVDNLQISSISAATITLTGPLGAVNSNFGAASASPTSFQISGSSLTPASGNLTVTPPAGYEVSLSSGSGYSTNLSVPYSSSALASTNVYVRLAATLAVGSYYGNIIVSGGGDAKAIATVLSTVSKAASTVTYDGTVSFTYNGAAQTPSITSITGSTGTRTTNYVGTGYASVNAPTNAGSYYISNTVASDANYNGVTNSLSFTINQATSTATLAVAITPVTYNGSGQSATVSVTASNTPGAVVNILTGGAATQTTPGTYAVTADYVPTNPNYTTLTGIAVGNFVIYQASTFVGASSTKNPSGYTDSVSYIATLPADASGSVVFSSTNGAFSTNTVSGTNTASLSITSLPRGTNLITVAFLGDSNYVGSTNSLNQIVTNHPPVANNVSYARNVAVDSFKVLVSDLLTNATDVDSDSLTLVAVGTSTNGVTPTISGGWVLYANTNAVADQFSYTVADGYGGTNSATVSIAIDSTPLFGQSEVVTTGGGTATLNFVGIPTYSYSVNRSTNLTDWITVWTTNAPAGGAFEFIDSSAPTTSAFYQLQYNP